MVMMLLVFAVLVAVVVPEAKCSLLSTNSDFGFGTDTRQNGWMTRRFEVRIVRTSTEEVKAEVRKVYTVKSISIWYQVVSCRLQILSKEGK